MAFRKGEMAAGRLDEAAAREAATDAAPDAEDFTWLSLRGTAVHATIWRAWGHELINLVAGEDLPQWRALEILCGDVLAGDAGPPPDEAPP